jgi:hypothetical protein
MACWAVKDDDHYLASTETVPGASDSWRALWLSSERSARAFASRGAAVMWCKRLGRGTPVETTPDHCLDAKWRESRRRRGISR